MRSQGSATNRARLWLVHCQVEEARVVPKPERALANLAQEVTILMVKNRMTTKCVWQAGGTPWWARHKDRKTWKCGASNSCWIRSKSWSWISVKSSGSMNSNKSSNSCKKASSFWWLPHGQYFSIPPTIWIMCNTQQALSKQTDSTWGRQTNKHVKSRMPTICVNVWSLPQKRVMQYDSWGA